MTDKEFILAALALLFYGTALTVGWIIGAFMQLKWPWLKPEWWEKRRK